MLALENSICLQGILSIFLVTVVCVTIGIKYEDTLIMVIIASLIIFLLNIGKIYYQKFNSYNNKIPLDLVNTKLNLNNQNHNLNLKSQLNQNMVKVNDSNNNENLQEIHKNNQKPFYLQNSSDNIMDARTYNLDDCTTDLSCIQKPDENNLFTGYEKVDIYTSPDTDLEILENKLEVKSKKKDNLIVENFQNCPLELNDVVKPFNNAVINPYKNYTMEEELIPNEEKHMSSKDIGNQICFNCKIGHCEGGVCRDINELKANDLKKIVKNVNQMRRVHPFSKNFPTILATNPDANY